MKFFAILVLSFALMFLVLGIASLFENDKYQNYLKCVPSTTNNCQIRM